MRNCYKCCHTNGRKRIKNDEDTTIDGCLPGKEIQPFFIVYFIGCLPLGIKFFCYGKVTFSSLHSQLNSSFSGRIDENIVSNDPVRIVNTVVDNLNLDNFKKLYKAIGRCPHHPKMMLK